MKILKKNGNEARQAGVALVFAVFGAFMAATMVAVMFTMAGVTSVRSQLNSSRVSADYLAQGAVEVAKKSIQTAIANWATPPTGGTALINGVSVPYTITATGGGPPSRTRPASRPSSPAMRSKPACNSIACNSARTA